MKHPLKLLAIFKGAIPILKTTVILTRTIILTLILSLCVLELSAYAQQNLTPLAGDNPLTLDSEETQKHLPGDRAIPSNRISASELETLRQIYSKSRSEAAASSASASSGSTNAADTNTDTNSRSSASENAHYTNQSASFNQRGSATPPRARAQTASAVASYPLSTLESAHVVNIRRRDSGVTIFPAALNAIAEAKSTLTLPATASAFATVLFGQEVGATKSKEVVARLDYAFLGPNDAVVEMNNCRVFLAIQSNFNTGRLEGEAKDLTCKSPSGDVFTIGMQGIVVDARSEYAGAEGKLLMKGPVKAAGLKFVTSMIEGYGQAMQAVEKTVSAVASDSRTERVENVTGSSQSYIQGKVLESTSGFLDRIIAFYDAMEPTLALAPGTTIHIINRHNIQIPKEFFGKTLPLNERETK